MKRTTTLGLVLLFSLGAAFADTPPPEGSKEAPDALKFDTDSKESTVEAGETTAAFAFLALNTTKSPININSVKTSCGCTVAQLPSTPYALQPGSNVAINVSMDVAGKQGQITKTVTVESSVGTKSLIVRANLPAQTN